MRACGLSPPPREQETAAARGKGEREVQELRCISSRPSRVRDKLGISEERDPGALRRPGRRERTRSSGGRPKHVITFHRISKTIMKPSV